MFENVNHPIKDGIIADNSTLSSRKIKEMVENATELPTPAAGDAGKALTVGEDLKYGLSAIPVELPTPAAGDNGKVLTVNSDLEYDLEAVPTEVPAPAIADNGKVLSVNSSGEYELTTPSSGGVSIVDFRIIGSHTSFDEMVFYDNTKTLQDIIDAVEAGNIVRLYDSANDLYLSLTQFHSWPDPDPRESIVTMAFSATYPATYESPVVNKQKTVYAEMVNPTATSLKLIDT